MFFAHDVRLFARRLRARRIGAIVTLALVACAAATSSLSAQATSPSPTESAPPSPPSAASASDLLRRMASVNAKLKSYEADVHLDVQMRSFPFIGSGFDGNVYYKQPDKQAVVFQTVPLIASQFKKVYPKLDPPGTWSAIYDVTPISDDGTTTIFRLIPKKNGRIEHLDVKADDATATVRGYTWTYKDGGFVTFDQTFEQVAGNYVIEKQTGHVELPSTKADVTSAFSHYRINVAIAASVFDDK
jgi:outer membrane lipoprotein-sorting protein